MGSVIANILEFTDNQNLIPGNSYWYKIKGIFNTFSSDLSATVQSGTSIYTLSSGLWSDPTIWSCGRVPNEFDDIFILENHIITIDNNYLARAKKIINQGDLKFGIDANLELNSQ